MIKEHFWQQIDPSAHLTETALSCIFLEDFGVKTLLRLPPLSLPLLPVNVLHNLYQAVDGPWCKAALQTDSR